MGSRAASERLLCALFCGISLFFIARSTIVVLTYYYIPLYWDEWEVAKFLSHKPSFLFYLNYLFIPHNEHIIATTKLLIYADYVFFDFATFPRILLIILTTVINAALLAKLTSGKTNGAVFYCTAAVFSASGLALVQWENLLWSFQTQFSMVLTGAITSILLALRLSVEGVSYKKTTLFALLTSIGFSILSLGNGILISISVIVLLILFKTDWLPRFVTIVVCIIYTKLFLPHTDIDINTITGQNILEIVNFTLTMIGGPISKNPAHAAHYGIVMLAAAATAFILGIVVPILNSRAVDRSIAGILALMGFLIATAAATAWARTSMGLSMALASRYATPMLLLWMSLFALLVRLGLLEPGRRGYKRLGVPLGLGLAIAVVSKANLSGHILGTIVSTSTEVEQAAYFIASGALAPSELEVLYPLPILEPLAFLRANRLNLFSDRMGLAMPPASLLKEQSASDRLPDCPRSAVDKVSRLSEDTWKIVGWAADGGQQTPNWIVARDASGRVLGFTKPLWPRPDVRSATSASESFKGFELPVRLASNSAGAVSINVFGRSSAAACRVHSQVILQRGA